MSTATLSKLRAERAQQGLSLRELAYFAGCSHTTIRRLEDGELGVAPATLARIARVLRVPVSDLWSPDASTIENEARATNASLVKSGAGVADHDTA
jgi:transcriptional regulator with XRE-family HTH domain